MDGHISFINVTFSYPTRKNINIFSGLNLKIKAGESVAVVGSSGSGKSTLAALLLRLYDLDDGSIFLDGMDVRNLHPEWLRKNIGTVSQV